MAGAQEIKSAPCHSEAETAVAELGVKMTQAEVKAIEGVKTLDEVKTPEGEKTLEEARVEVDKELEEKLRACVIGMESTYPVNEFLFSVDGVPVITKADLHTIGAKQKGGKTSLVSILLAAVVAGRWNRVRSLVGDTTVAYFDTEMKPIDTQLLAMKVATMAGCSKEEVYSRVHFLNFRKLAPKEMETGVRYYIEKLKPSIVIIDGIVDLCANFNDVEKSQNLVLNFLMKIAEEHQCAIVSILHTNKTDGYTELRGHLGAFFEQKGVTTVKCDKDDASNVVTVSFPTHRYAPVPDFHFTFDSEGLPIPADELHAQMEAKKQQTKDEEKAAKAEATYQERVKKVLGIIGRHGGSISRKELLDEAMEATGKGSSTVKDLIKRMKEDPDAGIVEENSVISMLTF